MRTRTTGSQNKYHGRISWLSDAVKYFLNPQTPRPKTAIILSASQTYGVQR